MSQNALCNPGLVNFSHLICEQEKKVKGYIHFSNSRHRQSHIEVQDMHFRLISFPVCPGYPVPMSKKYILTLNLDIFNINIFAWLSL